MAAAIAVLVAIWAIAYVAVGNDLLLPSFADCMRAAGELLLSPVFWTAFLGTLLRVLIAFCISFVLAVVFAVIAYMLPTFRAFFAPMVGIIRSLPVLAVLLIILVWTRSASIAPAVVAFLSLFPMLYTGISAALLRVDYQLIEMSRTYRVPIKKQIFGLYLPSALPAVCMECGAAFSFGLKAVVSAEVLARTANSLGNMASDMQRIDTAIPQFFAVIIVNLGHRRGLGRIGNLT
ncbi:MAG: ABC transporter permease subunit [Opitutales bacterium]|nr:ABC transporter permease subunit [Opitutales bacterium]